MKTIITTILIILFFTLSIFAKQNYIKKEETLLGQEYYCKIICVQGYQYLLVFTWNMKEQNIDVVQMFQKDKDGNYPQPIECK